MTVFDKSRKYPTGQNAGQNASRPRQTFSSAISFLQEEWRAHESSKNLWARERKALLKRAAELESESQGNLRLVTLLERRVAMLEDTLRRERVAQSAASSAAAAAGPKQDAEAEEEADALKDEIREAQRLAQEGRLTEHVHHSDSDSDSGEDFPFNWRRSSSAPSPAASLKLNQKRRPARPASPPLSHHHENSTSERYPAFTPGGAGSTPEWSPGPSSLPRPSPLPQPNSKYIAHHLTADGAVRKILASPHHQAAYANSTTSAQSTGPQEGTPLQVGAAGGRWESEGEDCAEKHAEASDAPVEEQTRGAGDLARSRATSVEADHLEEQGEAREHAPVAQGQSGRGDGHQAQPAELLESSAELASSGVDAEESAHEGVIEHESTRVDAAESVREEAAEHGRGKDRVGKEEDSELPEVDEESEESEDNFPEEKSVGMSGREDRWEPGAAAETQETEEESTRARAVEKGGAAEVTLGREEGADQHSHRYEEGAEEDCTAEAGDTAGLEMPGLEGGDALDQLVASRMNVHTQGARHPSPSHPRLLNSLRPPAMDLHTNVLPPTEMAAVTKIEQLPLPPAIKTVFPPAPDDGARPILPVPDTGAETAMPTASEFATTSSMPGGASSATAHDHDLPGATDHLLTVLKAPRVDGLPNSPAATKMAVTVAPSPGLELLEGAAQRTVDHTRQRQSNVSCASLLSHLDGVREVAVDKCADGSQRLLSASEDGTVKLWQLSPDLGRMVHEGAGRDVEPVATYRGHVGGVYSAAISVATNCAFSGGADAAIRMWRLAAPGSGLYSQHGCALPHEIGSLIGHTDVVWGLDVHSESPRILLSASADGTIRVWDTNLQSPLRCTLRAPTPPPKSPAAQSPGFRSPQAQPMPMPRMLVPTCVRGCPLDAASCIAGFDDGSLVRFDIESGEAIFVAEGDPWGGYHSQVNGVALHPHLPVVLAACADGMVRTYDVMRARGAPLAVLSAAEGGAACVAIDPCGVQLATAGHSGHLRLWDLRSTSAPSCTTVYPAHAPKLGEGVHTLAYARVGGSDTSASNRPVLATGGADGAVRLVTMRK
ncbi:hypothetical protein CYMTET_20486 [Cymbomonas tetramitiformis]|uniref:Striatin N-terminal domain-containing protein n=1 Tax=Cymbomonas tetramitiformis TaxID=36881 RepID=A0AAE0G3W2_9CHLO|nr:hypothetical protein CYMTET_20486 [Cymbomonas tetramitiformis]